MFLPILSTISYNNICCCYFLTNRVWGNENSLTSIDLFVKQWACLQGNWNLRTKGGKNPAQICSVLLLCSNTMLHVSYSFLPFWVIFCFSPGKQDTQVWTSPAHISWNRYDVLHHVYVKCVRAAPRWQVAPSEAGSEAGSAARVWEQASITGPVGRRRLRLLLDYQLAAEERNRPCCLKMTLFHVRSTRRLFTNVIRGPQTGNLL